MVKPINVVSSWRSGGGGEGVKAEIVVVSIERIKRHRSVNSYPEAMKVIRGEESDDRPVKAAWTEREASV